MAGDWMKIDLELPDKPEVFAIAGMVNKEPEFVVGALIKIWAWFDKHTTDGNAFGVTFSLPDRISGVTGFGEAMMFVGWLQQNDKTLSMPKFDSHTSQSAKTRALTNKRVEKSRNANVTLSPLPREEKRREDINTLVHSDAVDDCPHQKIIDLYHEKLPMLTMVKVWNDKRRNQLKSRWREDKKRQNLDYWSRIFDYIAESDLLTGRAGDWKADLEWITKSQNFVKIIEGKYVNRNAS